MPSAGVTAFLGAAGGLRGTVAVWTGASGAVVLATGGATGTVGWPDIPAEGLEAEPRLGASVVSVSSAGGWADRRPSV